MEQRSTAQVDAARETVVTWFVQPTPSVRVAAVSDTESIRQQAVGLLSYHRIALAYEFFQFRTIQHRDAAAAVTDRSVRLQFAGSLTDGLPADSQHIRDQLLCHRQLIAWQAVHA